MIKNAAIPLLTSIGLSPDADLVFRFLASAGPETVSGISRSLGLPPRRLRETLSELADVGAATRSARARTNLWNAVDVEHVRSEVQRRHQEAYLARRRLHRELAGPSRLGIAQDAPTVRVISSLTRARARLADLVARERFEHLVLNPDPVINIEAVCAAAPVHKALVEQRVAIKELGVPPEPGDATQTVAAQLVAEGAQFKVLPQVPAKILIFDRMTALVRLDPADPSRGVMEISDPDTVARLVELFYSRWQHASDYSESLDECVQLSTRERAILQLLAEGHTDKAVAHELGLSARTVAYSLSDVMGRLGVVSRLQLGVKIGPYLTGSIESATDIVTATGKRKRS